MPNNSYKHKNNILIPVIFENMQSKIRMISIIVGSSIAVAFILYVVSNALPEWYVSHL